VRVYPAWPEEEEDKKDVTGVEETEVDVQGTCAEDARR
jgi:hypothetical protein